MRHISRVLLFVILSLVLTIPCISNGDTLQDLNTLNEITQIFASAVQTAGDDASVVSTCDQALAKINGHSFSSLPAELAGTIPQLRQAIMDLRQQALDNMANDQKQQEPEEEMPEEEIDVEPTDYEALKNEDNGEGHIEDTTLSNRRADGTILTATVCSDYQSCSACRRKLAMMIEEHQAEVIRKRQQKIEDNVENVDFYRPQPISVPEVESNQATEPDDY